MCPHQARLNSHQETVAHLLSRRLDPSSSSDLCKQSSSPTCLSSKSIRLSRTSLCLSQKGCWPFKALDLNQQLVLPVVTGGGSSQPCLAYWQHRAAGCGPACHVDAMNAGWQLLQTCCVAKRGRDGRAGDTCNCCHSQQNNMRQTLAACSEA